MDKLLRADEVAALLKLNIMSFYGMVRRGGVPFVKIGSRLRFREDDIQEWLKAKNQNTAITKGACNGQ